VFIVRRPNMRRRLRALLILSPVLAAGLAAAPAAHAAFMTNAAPAGAPVLVSSMTRSPSGYRLTATEVLRSASRDVRVRAELRRHPRAVPYEYTRGFGQWQVSWFSATRPQKELMQVYVDDDNDRVEQVWTGYQVAWTMARGYPGAFGREVNAWYIWLALSALFIAPFVSYRRGRRQPAFVLDLVMLLGFSISLAFFNHAAIGLSVPLVYPFLLYVVGRMLLIANRRGLARAQLHTAVPVSWLGVATIFLLAFRIGLNVLNSNVIDVGYAGVIGADKLIHGVALYGHWPHDNLYGDTYGPVSYYLYVPFRLIFGWSGRWDTLPAAHAASICFDLITCGLLFLLGRRLRGPSLGVVLAYLWAAFPFTLYAMNSNTNDSLVAAAVVGSLLVIASAPARGVLALAAGATKFAPLALAPLLLRGTDERPRARSIASYVATFAISAFIVMLPIVLHADLGHFWRDSVEYQSNRVTPFSVWGLWGMPITLQNLLQGAVIALAVAVALLPSARPVAVVAALSAALLAALQLTLNYWLYPYVVWFFPLVIVALTASHPELPAAPGTAPMPAATVEPISVRIAG
jgi:hypothetical protein